MPAITRTQQGTGHITASEITLDGSNSLVFVSQRHQVLLVRNPTGAPINCTLDGSGGSSVPVPGVGSVDVSSGYTFSVGAGAAKALWLDSVSEYLKGTISVSGSGLIATLLG